MKTIDDLITSVTEAKEPISDILRRCLVLAHQLKNETFKVWIEKELNGYPDGEEVPDYRTGGGVAIGHFSGPLGSGVRNQPLPAHILHENHQHFANIVRLAQPIVAYDGVDKAQTYQLPWPADLTAVYQSKFIQGYALASAWMPVPGSMMAGVVDTVKTRVLKFALEIQDQLEEKAEAKTITEALPQSVVDRILYVTILGGNVSIGDGGIINANNIVAGDMASLEKALKAIGVDDAEFKDLQDSIAQDAAEAAADDKPKALGARTLSWIGQTTKKAAMGGLKIGADVATAVLTEWIKRQTGL